MFLGRTGRIGWNKCVIKNATDQESGVLRISPLEGADGRAASVRLVWMQTARTAGKSDRLPRLSGSGRFEVGIDRCPLLFHHVSFDIYQLSPLFA